jgi:HD-GYP domain-containing protein (c-di-GMP phosphodiesterase class II)
MLKSIKIVPEDVITIVYEHHENASGFGYPRHIKSIRIHPLARVVGIADAFCEITIKGPTAQRVRPVPEAFHYFEKNFSQFYARELMSALRDVISKSVPGLKKTG